MKRTYHRASIVASFLLLSAISPVRCAEIVDHSAFDSILQEAVQGGIVDYGKIQNRYQDLQTYLQSLAKADLKGTSGTEKLAFFINAYNAHCISGVLSEGQLKSVRQVSEFFEKTRFVLAGKELSLDALEHKVLRPMGEPRVHFALVCASMSCPGLAPRAYRAETLDADLDRQAKNFLRDSSKNHLDREKGVFYLSRIFQWFKEDFAKKKGSVLAFITPYLTEADREYLQQKQGRVKVEYLEYDWSLNGHY